MGGDSLFRTEVRYQLCDESVYLIGTYLEKNFTQYLIRYSSEL